MRSHDPVQIDSARLGKFLRAGINVEQLTSPNFGRLIGKIVQRETRIAFQNDEMIVAVHSRFEDQGRAGDPDRYRSCRNLGAAGIFSGVDQDCATFEANAAARFVELSSLAFS